MIKTAALVIFLALATASAAHADDKAGAQKLTSEGLALLDQSKPAEALAKFERAYALYASPTLLLNMGTALRALGRHAEAANAYARWIQARTNPQQRAEVEEILQELDAQVGVVTLDIDVSGADVTVDGSSVEPAGKELRLEPGSHAIVASKGGKTARATVQIRPGGNETVSLSLGSDTTKPDTPDTGDTGDTNKPPPDISDADPDHEIGITKPAEGGGSGTALKIAGISTAVVGLVAVGVGVKFGLDAKNINKDLEDVGPMDTWNQELLDKFDEGESAETRFIVFTAVGGAAVIAGGVLSYFGFTSGSSEVDSLALTPAVTGDSAGWVVSGSF